MRRRAAIVVPILGLLTGCQGAALLASPEATGSAAGPGSDPGRQIVVTLANPEPLLTSRAGATLKAYPSIPGYHVSAVVRRDVSALGRKYGVRTVTEWPIEVLGVHCVVYEIAEDRDRDDIIAAMAGDARVESVQPMQLFATQTDAVAYDDPYLDLQSSLAQMDVATVHRWSRGRGVVIAVVDAGLDADHPDLAGRVAASADFVSVGTDDFRRERHGLAVAGVIAAVAGNGQGIVGIAPEATLLGLRACWQDRADDEQSAGAVCNSLTLAQALAAAIDRRAAIINLSLTGPRDALLERLLLSALERNIIVVGAVADVTSFRQAFPTSVPGVIPVGMPAQAEPPAPPVLPAPGTQVLTLAPGGTYDFASGSSLAAAHVTGTVALMLARRPHLTTAEVSRALWDSVGRFVPAQIASPAVVNACQAVASVLGEQRCASDILVAAPDAAAAVAAEAH